MALGERKRIGDPGNQKISDLLHHINDDIEGILIDATLTQPLDEQGFPRQGSQPYWVYRIFTQDQGEIKLTTTGSNLTKQFDAAISLKQIDMKALPCVAITLSRITEYVDKNSGVNREYYIVVLDITEECKAVEQLRSRARQETVSKQAEPAIARMNTVTQNIKQQADQLDAIFADESEIPF